MQIYADITGLPFKIAASNQAVALGAAIFGAVAAGKENGGFASFNEAIPVMTKPPVKTFLPDQDAKSIYDELFELYFKCHDLFGHEFPDIMKHLKEIKNKVKGEKY